MDEDGGMPIDRPELSSLAGLIEQVTTRIEAMAKSSLDAHEDATANELFSIERALTGARRRLARLLGGR